MNEKSHTIRVWVLQNIEYYTSLLNFSILYLYNLYNTTRLYYKFSFPPNVPIEWLFALKYLQKPIPVIGVIKISVTAFKKLTNYLIFQHKINVLKIQNFLNCWCPIFSTLCVATDQTLSFIDLFRVWV